MRILIATLFGVCLGLAAGPDAIRTADAKPAAEPASKAEVVAAIKSVASSGHTTLGAIEAKLASEKTSEKDRANLKKDRERLKGIVQALDDLSAASSTREREALIKAIEEQMTRALTISTELMKSWYEAAKAAFGNLKG